MVRTQPKLIVVGASPEDLESLRAWAGDQFDVRAQPDESSISAVLRAMGEGVCIVSPEGETLWSNDYFDALDEGTRERVHELCESALDDDDAQGVSDAAVVTKRRITNEDETRSFEVYITAIGRGVSEQGRRVAAVVRDVTISARFQQKMDAIDRAGFELVRLDVDQIREMNALERLQLLEQRIVASLHGLMRSDHFAIFLINHKRDKLDLVMQSGLPQEIQDLDLYLESEGSGISGYVAKTGESYICHDTTSDERFLPGLRGASSSLTVPLRISDKVIGIMDIESQKPRAFDDQDRQFAEIFGRYIAMALHMLQLLVTERSTTNETVSGRFEGQIHEPLEDIVHEIDWLREHQKSADPETSNHIDKILGDVDSIKQRVRNVSQGPQTVLGVEAAMLEREVDPLMAGKRVLIADDSPKVRKIIGEVLGHRGCETTVVNDGSAAIAELKRVGAGEREPFDLILSDIQMPDRNGYEVFSSARANCSDAPVILMTGFGYDPHHSIVRASQEGLSSVLFKPFEIELLMNQVREAFADRQ